MGNIAAGISIVIGDILNQLIFRGDKEIQIIANDIGSSIALIVVTGIVAGISTRDNDIIVI